jgi:hypothetical protein
VQEHTKELKKKLVASEEARKDAEAKATSANDLQTRLDAAELALKEKTEHTDQREVDIIKRLDKQSDRFSSTVSLPFLLRIFVFVAAMLVLRNYLLFSISYL